MHGNIFKKHFPGGRCKKIEEATRFSKSEAKKQQSKSQKKSQELGVPWDFYLYVAITLLGWDIKFFLKSTPNLWLKSYIQWLETNTDFETVESVTLDKSPFW